jgi:hypothetical protein
LLNQNIDIFIVKTEKINFFAHILFVFTCQLGFQGQRKIHCSWSGSDW